MAPERVADNAAMLSVDVGFRGRRSERPLRLRLNGGTLGILGPPGAGKSMVLGIIAGLIRPDRGHILLGDEPLFDATAGVCVPPHRRRVGFVFQGGALFPHLSVKGNLCYGLDRVTPQMRRWRLDDVVELLALAPLLGVYPRRLYGNERLRVALGRSLLASPRLLLLDEPLAGLAPRPKTAMVSMLQQTRDKFRVPTILVSRHLREILSLTDQLALMENGRIMASGAFDEIQRRKTDSERFGLDNILPAVVRSHEAEDGCTVADMNGQTLFLPLRSDLAIGRRIYVTVNRREIALSRWPVLGSSIQNQWPVRIVGLKTMHHSLQVGLEANVPLLAEISPRACRDLALRESETVYALIKSRAFTYLLEDAPAAASGDEDASRSRAEG